MVGRNEPCPCGSGKKYKHCCLRADEARARARASGGVGQGDAEAMQLQQAELDEYRRHCEALPQGADIPSFMEYLGRGSPASDVIRTMRDEIAGRDFESEDDLRNFVDRRMNTVNDEAQPDFEGLSPAQMHEILEARRSNRVPLMRFRAGLAEEDVVAAPIVTVLKWLLQYHAQHNGEVRLTDRDNYPRVICREYVKRFAPWERDGQKIPREESLEDLVQVHDIIVSEGWADESRHRSILTTEGVQLLKAGGSTEIFEKALAFLLFQEEWVAWLGEEFEESGTHFEIIQNAAIFTLYVLSRHPTGTVSELFGRFTRAFPAFSDPAEGDHRVLEWLEGVFVYLFVDRFAVPMGLVEVFEGDGQGDRYRVTALFQNAFVW